MPQVPNAPYRPRSPNALARALRPEYIGLDLLDYQDIAPEVMELASADHLRPSLIDVDRNSPGAVGYLPHGGERPVFVAVTPEEFTLLAGSVQTLGRTATSRTLEARGFPLETTKEDKAAARRAGVHAVEGKLAERPANLRKLEHQLDGHIIRIKKFQEAAAHPGLARGSEETMRMRITYLRTYILPDMFRGVGINRDWSQDQAYLAIRAMEKLLFIERGGNRHIGHLRGMLVLAHDWNGHKLAITRSRIWQSRKYIRQNSKGPAA